MDLIRQAVLKAKVKFLEVSTKIDKKETKPDTWSTNEM
jgi:hypothetical protein